MVEAFARSQVLGQEADESSRVSRSGRRSRDDVDSSTKYDPTAPTTEANSQAAL